MKREEGWERSEGGDSREKERAEGRREGRAERTQWKVGREAKRRAEKGYQRRAKQRVGNHIRVEQKIRESTRYLKT